MIDAKALSKHYGRKLAVDQLASTFAGVVTGFLGPNGSGKSTTMRMIMGLDAPNAGDVTVNGRHYHDLPGLCTRSARSWRQRRSILAGALALTFACSRQTERHPASAGRRSARDRRADVRCGPARRQASPSAWVSGSVSPPRSSAIPGSLLFDEPVNGLDPDGIRWVRNLLKGLAREGRTVFVSSHLMSEMALTGRRSGRSSARGRLIAQVHGRRDYSRRAAQRSVRVRSREVARLRSALESEGPRPTMLEDDGSISVSRARTRLRSVISRPGSRSHCTRAALAAVGLPRGGFSEGITEQSVEYHGAEEAAASVAARGGAR